MPRPELNLNTIDVRLIAYQSEVNRPDNIRTCRKLGTFSLSITTKFQEDLSD